MVFEPNPYSVLIVSPGGRLRESLAPLLPPGEYAPVVSAHSAGEARRCLLGQEFDLIVINSPLPDGPGIQLAEDLCGETEAGVLLLVKAEAYEEVADRVRASGVLTLYKPSSRLLAGYALKTLCAMRERLRSRGRRAVSVEEKIRELRIIDRAKWALIEGQGLSEPEAHRALERMAMERRVTKKQAALEIIEGASPKNRKPPV